jgi:hypothetical protein
MRGEIQNRGRARQLRNFSGLRFGNITPTDIDGFIEFRDRLFVYIEAKLAGAELPAGQRLALERNCDAVEAGGRVAAVLIVEHDTEPEDDIDVGPCAVREYRFKAHWQEPISPTTCREAIERLLRFAEIII